MNRRIFLCLCLFAPAFAVGGRQSRQPRTRDQSQTGELFPVSKDGKWGFIDRAGRVRIAPRFESAADFSEGLARVGVGGRVAFVNAAGGIVFRPRFDSAGDFHEGLAFVETGWKTNPHIGITTETGRWGFVNRAGRLAVPLKFTRADAFSEGLAAVQLGESLGERSGFVDHAGRLVFEFPFDVSWGFHEGFALVRSKQGTFFLDRAGKKLATPEIDDYQARSFSEGLAAVQINGKWGYVDRTGKLVIPAQFKDALEFSEGLAAVRLPVDDAHAVTCPLQNPGDTSTNPNLYGYVDRAGRLVIPPQFEYAKPFSEGLAAVSNCSKPAFIDETGAVVLSVPFDEANAFAGGLASVLRYEMGGARIGYVDRAGKVVWEPTR
ncbi:MAG: WG repeat-containing protein [Acidobacteria bacterium]|nr:WG repeat-containing protein [Acidobacteriota bacterium]